MGFWPGGDRDGNPFVKTETTIRVAEALRAALLRCYYFDVRRLKRRLTFKEVDLIIAELGRKIIPGTVHSGSVETISYSRNA